MTRRSFSIALVLVVATTLAGVGSLVPAYSVAHGLDRPTWFIGWLCTVMVGIAFLVQESAGTGKPMLGTSRAPAVLLFAIVNPLATEMVLLDTYASVAVAATALSAAIAFNFSGRFAPNIAGFLAGTACYFDATSIVWPIAGSLAWIAQRRWPAAILLSVGAFSGIAAGRGFGLPWLTSQGFHGAGAFLNRDLSLLLPSLMLGLAAYFRDPTLGKVPSEPPLALRRWAELSVLGLLIVAAGSPLNVRLLALPFWWYLPSALLELCQALREPRRIGAVGCAIAMLAAAVLVALAQPIAAHLTDGPLLAYHLL